MSSFRERNDRKRPSEDGRNPRNDKGFRKGGPGGGHGGGGKPGQRPQARREDAEGWIWGRHAVEAALGNPDREGPFRVAATEGAASHLSALIGKRQDVRLELMEPHDLQRMLPAGAAHQGQALKAPLLEGVGIEELAMGGPGVIVMLDQVTDPQNVGAIFRSAAAFGAKGIVLQDRNSPQLSGALAKAAAGAIERLPCARVVNLSRALEKLNDLGWRAVGLDGSAEETLDHALDSRPTVIVMGSEGEGLRRLVAEHCDILAKIPMPGGFESLNVSNAAAVALYEATRRRG